MSFAFKDGQLIDGIRKRDNACFEIIYKRCWPIVAELTHKTGGSTDDVKDLLQDSLIIAYENVVTGVFQAQSGIVTYVCGIARNRWNTYLDRRKKRNIPLEQYSELMNLATEDDTEESINNRASFATELLLKSTDRCKEILVAYYYNNLSMEQIALKLGYTNSDNAKSQKSKCMEKLRTAARTMVNNEF